MANDESMKVLKDAKYCQGVVTRNVRCRNCLLLLLLVPTLSSLFHSCDAQTNTSTDKAALLAFKKFADPDNVLTTWNNNSDLCAVFPKWKGISCNTRLRVFKVSLNDTGLSGTFESGTLNGLDKLRNLVVSNNKFRGSIPDDLADITGLQKLWAENAQFSGGFPNLVNSGRLKVMSLSGNNLSGPIPDLSKLTALSVLDLSANSFIDLIPALPPNIQNFSLRHNQLNGSIPSSLPSTLMSLDLRDNQLSGPVPPGLGTISSIFIGGNPGLCGPLTQTACPPAQNISQNITPSLTIHSSVAPGKHKKQPSGLRIFGWVVGNIIGLAMIIYALQKTIIYLLEKKKMRADIRKDAAATRVPDMTPASLEAPGAGGQTAKPEKSELIFVDDAVHKFDLEDLLRASAEILGKGSLGTTYRTHLDTGNVAVVKRLKDVREMNKKEFEKEMAVVGRMKHPNLLPLRAYYYSEQEKLLVYDYMYNGSLASVLHGPKDNEDGHKPFVWDFRLKVAHDVAVGLSFLHEKCPVQMSPHHNLKSSNVLLGCNYEAYLADYFLVPLVPPKMAAQGKTGYVAPEYNRSKKKSQTADVYSFGVLLLELLTGRRPAHSSDEEGIDLPEFVKSAVREAWTVEVFDLQLKNSMDGDAEMVSVLQMAMTCVESNPDQRPPLTQVVKVLQSIRHSKDDDSLIDFKSALGHSEEYDNNLDYDSKGYDSQSPIANSGRLSRGLSPTYYH